MKNTFKILKLEWMAEDLPIELNWHDAQVLSKVALMLSHRSEHREFIPIIRVGNWRLPTIDELSYLMEVSQYGIGGIWLSTPYWTSTEDPDNKFESFAVERNDYMKHQEIEDMSISKDTTLKVRFVKDL